MSTFNFDFIISQKKDEEHYYRMSQFSDEKKAVSKVVVDIKLKVLGSAIIRESIFNL